jgi:hypothetical protein
MPVQALAFNEATGSLLTKAGSFFVIAFLLAACNADNLLEASWYKGTTKGFHICKMAADREGARDPALTTHCLERHQRSMAEGSVTEVASTATFYEPQNTMSWGGEIRNNSKTHVVTSFAISLVSRTDPHTKLLMKTFSDQWIEPGGRGRFEIFEPKKERGIWNVSDVKGIEVR